MKLATWNVNSLTVRLPQVIDWLKAQESLGVDHAIDVLALQELKMTDDKFPLAAFTEAGYHAQWFGQKTYNGVALISRSEGTQVVKNIPGFQDDMSRVITATFGDVRVIGGYFPNGQAPDSDKFVYKMRWLAALHQWVKQEMSAHPKLVLMGDYNITFDDLCAFAARNEGHAVVSFLTKPLSVITRFSEGCKRKFVVGHFEFLQSKHIDGVIETERLLRPQPVNDLRQPYGERVDIPSGKFHEHLSIFKQFVGNSQN